MITGAAASTVLYNIRLRHPTLELPIIDYDLALLFQPMLILGISIGVTLNVLFSDWMITILLIIIFGGTDTPLACIYSGQLSDCSVLGQLFLLSFG
jgi:hypothetical protein